MSSPTSPAPAVAPSSAVKPSQCRPGTLAGELRIALLRTARRLRMERSSSQITDGRYSVLAALIKYGPLSLGILTSHGRFVRGARPRRPNWDDAADDLTAAQTDNQTPEMVQIID